MNDHLPPPNSSIRWFRVVLWLMPTCIAVTTPVALILLPTSLVQRFSDYWLLGWLAMNLLTTYALGIFDAKLSGPERRPNEVFFPAAWFLMAQILIVPSLLFAGYLLLMAIYSIAP